MVEHAGEAVRPLPATTDQYKPLWVTAKYHSKPSMKKKKCIAGDSKRKAVM